MINMHDAYIDMLRRMGAKLLCEQYGVADQDLKDIVTNAALARGADGGREAQDAVINVAIIAGEEQARLRKQRRT